MYRIFTEFVDNINMKFYDYDIVNINVKYFVIFFLFSMTFTFYFIFMLCIISNFIFHKAIGELVQFPNLRSMPVTAMSPDNV